MALVIRREKFLYKFAGGGVYGLKVNTDFHWCEPIYDAKAAELILYGRALGLAHGEAEDVLQEMFLTLMQMEAPPAQPENYVVRSFRNRALNYRRSLWRRVAREILAESHYWFEKSSEQSREEKDLQEKTVRALNDLPLEQREVIVLKIWHGRTFEEIGGLLEISANTVAGRYRYGLQKLKSKIEGVEHERIGRESVAWLATAPAINAAEA
jgi:RNA polymerase sigma-70 factor, ECF subfamily